MKLKIWLGRIIPLVIIALGEIVLYSMFAKLFRISSIVFFEINISFELFLYIEYPSTIRDIFRYTKLFFIQNIDYNQ